MYQSVRPIGTLALWRSIRVQYGASASCLIWALMPTAERSFWMVWASLGMGSTLWV